MAGGPGGVRVAVCWMLTPDDGRGDGRHVGYLDRPALWRGRDPGLFDALADLVRTNCRTVAAVEARGLVPGARYYAAEVPDAASGRDAYFAALWPLAAGRELVFFDPDNGLEVPSVPRGRRGAARYLYREEAEAALARGHSILVYQHFPRVRREPYVAARAAQLLARPGVAAVTALQTRRVGFFLAARAEHAAALAAGVAQAERAWAGTMAVRTVREP